MLEASEKQQEANMRADEPDKVSPATEPQKTENTAPRLTVDVRAVELVKASSANPLRSLLNPGETDNYVCLGHFDFLKIRKVENKGNSLLSIENDDQKYDKPGSNYKYPLYLLHYPAPENSLETFWNTSFCYVAVSRIHFRPFKTEGGAPASGVEQIEKLKTSVRSLSERDPDSGNCLGETSVLVEDELVHCVFYHTLELGDVVAVLKSNSMVSCLHVLRRLLETAPVGDVYSYCGVHAALFGVCSAVEAAKAWDKGRKGRKLYSVRGAEVSIRQVLPKASIRFSVRSARCARKFWDALPRDGTGKPERLSLVIGTADAIADISGHCFRELIDYTRTLLYDKYPLPSGTETFDMYDAFDDVISRIGILYGDIYDGANPLEKIGSSMEIKKRQDALTRAVNKLKESGHYGRWISALTAQTSTLVTMMENCVTDDLSILIWPSVSALMDRLSTHPKIGKKQAIGIKSFLNGWDILESDITRLEGQLAQRPELQSSRYYTPATLMVFYMALLHAYNELLLSINGDEPRQNFIPLITYDVEPRTNTLCILDSADDSMGGYEGETPLLVSLPVSLMYRPFEVAAILCHELAHYTGDSSRQRKKRFNCILVGCAGRIADAWKLDGRGKYPLCGNGSTQVLEEIKGRLQKYYDDLCQEKTSNRFYIYQISVLLPQALSQVFFSRDLQSSLVSKYLDGDTLQGSLIAYVKEFKPYEQYQTLCDLKRALGNLLLLYRECYADLAAVLCLGLTVEEYLLCMFYWEDDYVKNREEGVDQEKLAMLYLQAALVLNAVEFCGFKPFDALFSRPEARTWLDEWIGQIKYYQETLKTGQDILIRTDTTKRISIPAEYIPLAEYLQSCARTLVENFDQKIIVDTRQEIRDMLSAVSGDPDFKTLHMIIAKYRETLFGGFTGR